MSMHSKVCDPEALNRLSLFQGLSDHELRQLRTFLHYRTCTVGTTIMVEGQPGDALYILLRGAVKVWVEQSDGANAILAICGAGEVLGEISILDGGGHSASVATLQDCEMLCMGHAAFNECLLTIPVLCRNVARSLARRLRRLSRHTQAMSTLDVRGRLAHQLLVLSEQYGVALANGSILIQLQLTQNDFACISGCSRMQVNRILNLLQKQRVVSFDLGHHVIIHDQSALSRYCATLQTATI